MSNPWLTNNPFMSMWLNEVNRMAGTLRGQAITQDGHQISGSIAESIDDDLRALMRELAPASPRANKVIDFSRALANRRAATRGPDGSGLAMTTEAPIVAFPSADFHLHTQ